MLEPPKPRCGECNQVDSEFAKLKSGTLLELIDEKLDAITENIADVATAPTAKRKLTIEVEISPNENRDAGTVRCKIKTHLASDVIESSTVFFGRDPSTGRDRIHVSNPKQETIQFGGAN